MASDPMIYSPDSRRTAGMVYGLAGAGLGDTLIWSDSELRDGLLTYWSLSVGAISGYSVQAVS